MCNCSNCFEAYLALYILYIQLYNGYDLYFVTFLIYKKKKLNKLCFYVSGNIGVCYGLLGDNLPQPSAAVSLIKSTGIIGSVRLYRPDPNVLQALRGSDLHVLLGVPNSDLQSVASDPSTAAKWVQTNIQPYVPGVRFKYLAVGNQVIPGWEAQFVLPAMQNMWAALASAGLTNQIAVSTSVSTGVLGQSYPPSAGAFTSDALQYLQPIVQFLINTRAPFLANVYPYFSYIGNPHQINIRYALFTSPGTVVQDGQFAYQNLFDAILDALYSALEKIGGSSVPVVVSESGWPSNGGSVATIGNAQAYNSNLIRHVGQGTPKRPGHIEAYIFALFNENQKQPQGTENNFGLFYPNMQPVYPFHSSKCSLNLKSSHQHKKQTNSTL